MKLPKCKHCEALAVCRYMEASGVDAGGIAYGGRELTWFCMYSRCSMYEKPIDPQWVDVPEA